MGHKDPSIIKVSGPLVVAENMREAKMYEVVFVGESKLVGEVIRLQNGLASIQVYEETAGIGPGEPVELTGNTMCAELGPGLLETIYDGVQRPLKVLESKSGHFLARGVMAEGLDREKKWEFKPKVKSGDKVFAGDILGTVQETSLIEHRVLVPVDIKEAIVDSVEKGKFTVTEDIVILKTGTTKRNIQMLQRWPIRIPRPVSKKNIPSELLRTGGRSIDMFFPLAK